MSQEPMIQSGADQLDNSSGAALDTPSLDEAITDGQFPGNSDDGSSTPYANDHSHETDHSRETDHALALSAPSTTGATAEHHHTSLKTPTVGAGTGRPKGSVQIREPPVSEKRGYKIVKIEQKHGLLHRAIPVMPLWIAILCCVLNILLPGTGTLISAFTVFCCGVTTRLNRPLHAMALNLVSGLLQTTTFLLIVGWIWSILWGMTFVQLALSAKEDAVTVASGGLPYYVRRHSSVE